MRYLKKLVLLPLVAVWVIVDLKFEPFKSHFWLTLVCAVASVPLMMAASGLIAWFFRSGKAKGAGSSSRARICCSLRYGQNRSVKILCLAGLATTGAQKLVEGVGPPYPCPKNVK